MKIDILIRRQQPGEQFPGTLRAWTIDQGCRGTQLLKHSISTSVKTAMTRLRNRFPGHEIEFVVVDNQEA